MKTNEETKQRNRKLTDAEYTALCKKLPPTCHKRSPNLRRLTDEEYERMVKGEWKNE